MFALQQSSDDSDSDQSQVIFHQQLLSLEIENIGEGWAVHSDEEVVANEMVLELFDAMLYR